jgi:hypothetical protein
MIAGYVVVVGMPAFLQWRRSRRSIASAQRPLPLPRAMAIRA